MTTELKPLPEALHDFSAARDDRGLFVFELYIKPDGGLRVDQASYSGLRLAREVPESYVLEAVIDAIRVTAQHFERELLPAALRREGRGARGADGRIILEVTIAPAGDDSTPE